MFMQKEYIFGRYYLFCFDLHGKVLAEELLHVPELAFSI